MSAIDTLKNLERLEALVDESMKFAGFFRFNDEEFYMLVNKIRASLPEDLRRAGKIAQNSERIVEAAQSEADQALEAARNEGAQMLQEARAQAQALIDDSEITRLATARAQEIVERAQAEAQEVRAGADEYAADVLTNLESQVQEVLSQLDGRISGMISTIQRGRQKLEQRPGRAPAAERRSAGGINLKEAVNGALTRQNGRG